MDDRPSHGEEPGSPAYNKRLQDAVPDEVAVVPDIELGKELPTHSLEPSVSPEGKIIPRTVVEKVDPSSPSHGEVPGTLAYNQRLADATPDLVIKAPAAGKMAPALYAPHEKDVEASSRSEVSVPETVITRVESLPACGKAQPMPTIDRRCGDAPRDVLERTGQPAGKQ